MMWFPRAPARHPLQLALLVMLLLSAAGCRDEEAARMAERERVEQEPL